MSESLYAWSQQLADIVSEVSGAVVEVHGRKTQASGVVVDPEAGLIITTTRPLSRRRRPIVRVGGSETAEATVRGVARGADLALLSVSGLSLGPAPTWQEKAPRVGEMVLTIGRQESGPRVTSGLVSAVSGPWRTRDGRAIARWVEVDASLPSISAGGLLVNLRGEALGFNTPMLTRKGAVLPPQTLTQLIKELRAGTPRRRGYLGVGVQLVRLPTPIGEQTHGLLINAVDPSSPASAAGLMLGDVLFTFDGHPLDASMSLIRAMAHRVDAPTEVQLLRAGNVQTATVTPTVRGRRGHSEE